MSTGDRAAVGPAVLRVAIGAVFIGAGLQKLLGIWGGTGIRGATALFQAIHLAPAYPLAVFITLLELVGGSLLVVGAFTGWMAMPLVVEMIIAECIRMRESPLLNSFQRISGDIWKACR